MSNPRPAFMSSLQSLCRSVDKQVADLERETRTAVLVSKGPYASNAADQLRDEAAALNREIENSLGTVVEERNNMTSFLEEMRVQFGEIVSETLKMEEFMGQYGFKSKTPVNLEDILNWDVPQESTLTPPAAAEFGKEVLENIDTADTSVHDTDTMIAVPMSKPKSKTPPAQTKPAVTDSPNFFDVGLSNLAMELYAGKSVRSNQPRPKPDQPLPRQDQLPNKAPSPQVYLKPQPQNASAYIQDDSMYAASPVLRLSSKLTKQTDLSNMSNMSNMSTLDTVDVDITPGLPSRKKSSARPANLPDTPVTARLSTVTATAPENDTPVMPELQTVNFATFNWQQSSSASPDLQSIKPKSQPPGRPSTPDLPMSNLPTSDTPELPDLQTMDIRKLVLDSKPARRITPTEPSLHTRGMMCEVVKENTPEEPQLTGHYNQYKHLTTTEKENTPEEPQLTGHYHLHHHQPHLSAAFPLPKKNTPELPELSILQNRQERTGTSKTKSPETPVLSFNYRN